MKKIVHLILAVALSGMAIAEVKEPCGSAPGGGGGGGGGDGLGSGDPNEMCGPIGVGNPGTQRFVKPGEPMTYTVYFENVSTATAAAADVYVTNPLSEWLDWSTFEMGEVAFNNQTDLGLIGKNHGSCDTTLNGTNFLVRTELGGGKDGKDTIAQRGVVRWHLRIVDPTTDTGNPKDILAGFLQPNDDTHRGEGHLTYRIKVRDDAPANVVITNSASIVFDYNDPIETDPAWWNTVGQVADIAIEGEGVDFVVTNLSLVVGAPYGEALSTVPTTGKPGYTFAGWYTGSNGTGRHITAESLVEDGDDGLYAYWAANTYFIAYNSNGGEGEMAIQTNTYDVVSCLASNEFTNIGYVFAGWATQEDGEVVYGDGAVVSNLTSEADSVVDLYAIWGGWKIDFAATDIAVDEGCNIVLRVNGGSSDKASSVQVYLAYNTAAAADIDLAKGMVDGAAPKGGLKFPLTLSWAKGEIGEKVITIPVKTDKTVEDDEFFTLQLAAPQGLTLGDATVCTVTIRDLNDKTLKASVTPYKPKKNEAVATNSVTVASGDAKGGFVAGTGEYTSGSKLTLTAEARPGWAFVGWRLKDGGEAILSDKAKWQVVVTNDEDYVAVFEKIPYVRGLADPADGGKVAGSGFCAAGKKVTLKATANKNFAFLGWRQATGSGEQGTGNGFVATTPSLVIDRTAKPAANSKTSTTITNIAEDVTFCAVFKSYPEVFVTVEATDEKGAEPTGKGAGKYVAGTITGMGKYAIGKTKIALKATANKGYVFSGWYNADDVLLTKDATYTIPSMGENDVEYTAKFITAEEDKGSITLAVDGVGIDAAVSSKPPYRTNVWAGVYLEWPVAANALSATTIKVSGLPAGLKYTAKPVTSKVGSGKTAVVVTNVPANTIYGAPTAASKADKYGNVKPSAVKVTVTTAGKSSQAYQIDMVVDALPTWAQGTFAGGVWREGDAASYSGTVSLTVGAAGKVSGKVLGDGLAYTLAAPYYTGFAAVSDGYAIVSNFIADVTASWSYKEGNKTVKTNEVVRMAVHDNGIGGYAAVEDWFEAYTVNWKVEPWKTRGKTFDKKTRTYAILSDGTFSENEEDLTSALGADVTGRVTLKFSVNGTVNIAGEFAQYDEKKKKYTTVKATGSATLVPVDEAQGVVFIYLTPKGLTPHARCMEVLLPQD